MNRTTEILTIESVDQIPTLESIRTIPRDRTLKLIFNHSIQTQRETIGQNFKKELLEFQVGIHLIEPEINIAKLITDKEIRDNQLFFENCARDYRSLGGKLISKFVNKKNVKLNSKFPLLTFNQFKQGYQSGTIEEWKYFIHGFHCGFEHKKTGQIIEVPLVFGLEFGDLDPYFFTRFIKSTPAYRPLPVQIFEDYTDGVRINDTMLSIGRFERINSNIENHFGIAVTDRNKIEVDVYRPQEKPKFSLLQFLGLK